LLFAKVGDCYCYNCGNPIKPQTVEQILQHLQTAYQGKKVYLLKESGTLNEKADMIKFVKNNKQKVEKGTGFTRYLLVADGEASGNDVGTLHQSVRLEPIEYFYLEEPKVPEKYFPLKVYGIYDRITMEEERMPRLKEDIIKILGESKKFGVWVSEDYSRDDGLPRPNGEAVNND
jgi:excinuclease UvrABC ATPase subunit